MSTAKARNSKNKKDKPEPLRYNIPERFLSNTEPIPLFQVGGEDVSITMISADAGTVWADKCFDVVQFDDDIAYMAGRMQAALISRNNATNDEKSEEENVRVKEWLGKLRAVQAKKWNRVKELLTAYDGKVFTSKLFGEATAAQLLSAFQTLKQYCDPFVVGSALQDESMRELAEITSRIGAKK